MSNIAGKAYAMNLITPVYVSTGWLSIFFVPGALCILKALSYWAGFTCGMLPAWIGIVTALLGVALVVLGLTSWLNITSKFNEFVLWGLGFVCFVATSLVSLNLATTIVLIVFGLLLLGVGFLFLSQGVVWLNRFIFWLAGLPVFQKSAFGGLLTLSLIHYARWVILRDKDFPVLSDNQPREKLKYGYMLFFSNFNGSWTQYVDSFSSAIPGGLNLLWHRNIGWPNAVPETPFNKYVVSKQIWTEHYYNAYPLASSNDVKSAKRVMAGVLNLSQNLDTISAEDFKKVYDQATLDLQFDLSQMEPTPIVSLADEAIAKRRRIESQEA